jgi:hypothetical protein
VPAVPPAEVTAAAPAAAPPGLPSSEEEAETAWKIRIGEAALVDAAVEVTDEEPGTPATLAIADLDVTLRELSNEPGASIPMELAATLGGGGKLSLAGTLVALPETTLDADLKVEGLALAQLQPYLSDVARVGIRGGALGLDGRMRYSDDDEPFAFDGDLRITGFDTHDLVKNEKLLAWRTLALDDLELSLAGNRARIARVRIERPFGRLFIARDQSTNVGALLVEEAPAGTPAEPGSRPAAQRESDATPPFRVRVGRVVVARGELDFTDQSLPLPFAARIQDLQGELTTIDTGSAAPSRIRLEGKVDEYGLARVEGQMRISAPTELADIGVIFRNIEMSPYSPYTIKFAGRKIARGKIDLDLRYQLTDRQLVGANRIVIDELELGEKVPHPDAVDLPLGLAVALLKDSEGRIDLDMPVSGSLDDPEFGIGKVIWKAFVNLITRIATAPFRLLGNLIGVESEDLGTIVFAPGRSDLLPPEKEKLLRVAEALGKRPQLGVEIPAAVDPEADGAVLRTNKVQAAIDTALGVDPASGAPPSGRGLERRTRKAVEELFTTRFPAEPLEPIQARFQAPPPDDPEGRPRLDELAYLDELRERIASSESVSTEELAALGAARAQAIAAELTSAGQVAAERVRAGARKDVSARDGAWVPLELGVGGATE